MDPYQVVYARLVIDFMIDEIESERVYNRVDEYRRILALFPDIGREYDPCYEAARPSFACRCVAVPDTPFTLYYVKDDELRRVAVFYIEHQRANPRGRFAAAPFSN